MKQLVSNDILISCHRLGGVFAIVGVKPAKAMWRVADDKRFDGLCNLDTAESEKGDNRRAVLGDTEQY